MKASIRATGAKWYCFTALCLVLVGIRSTHGAAQAIYLLGPPELVAEMAMIPVTLEYSADDGRELAYFALDVTGSSSLLTADGTDFSRFSFEPNGAVIGGWNPIPGTGFGAGDLRSGIEYDTLTEHLGVGSHLLGTLKVNLQQIPLPTTVTIDSAKTDVGVETPGNPATFEFLDPEFRPGTVELVPEPAIFAGIWAAMILLVARRSPS